MYVAMHIHIYVVRVCVGVCVDAHVVPAAGASIQTTPSPARRLPPSDCPRQLTKHLNIQLLSRFVQ